MFRRFVHFRAEPSAEGKPRLLRILASTDDAVDMGGWREVLKHGASDIDTSAATALLLNHDPNRIIGALRKCSPDGRCMEVEAELDEEARCDSDMKVGRAVDMGALKGASVGYAYERGDCTFDEASRTVTVNRWRLLELSLTPTPADKAAGIRSIPHDLDHKEPAMADPVPTPVDPKPAILAEQRQIAELARSLKLDPAGYVGQDLGTAKDAMLAEVAKRSTEEHKAPAHTVTITAEESDKQADAVYKAIEARVYGKALAQDGNPYAGRKYRDMAARWAARHGEARTEDWSDKQRAEFALGFGKRTDAANVITSNFANFVFLNAMDKILAKGMEMVPKGLVGPSGQPIYDTQTVSDFKTYYVGGIAMGLLTETKENEAFPELTKTEGVYSDSAKKWGGTLSLTVEALISDDTASFDRALRQAPVIAQKSIEKRLVQKFLRGIATTDASTWTSNTTSGCTPVWTTADTLAAARANIGKGAAAMANKVGMDGNPLGNMPRFVFAGPTSGNYLAGLLGTAPGQTVQNAQAYGQYELVISPWLESTGVTGYSTTSYYLIADPMVATGLVLTKIAGYENIQVQEFDAGAVGARKWKLWLPYEADLFWAANSAGTSIIYGAHQCTT